MNPKVDFFFDNSSKWQEEYAALRNILLDCGLHEELKWGCPCYTFQQKNVVLIHGFKDYCALLFFKGAVLSNALGLLIQQSENVQAARQIRFTHIQQIHKNISAIKSNIFEAIEVEKQGIKVDLKKTSDFIVVEEFQHRLNEFNDMKIAFEKLSPGRQRAYLLYFSQAKQPTTRIARIEKCIPLILNGKGLND